MFYDTVVSGGRVIDPGRKIDAFLDLALLDGRIARVAPGLDPTGARRWIDARGRIVVPGLIDLHAHVYYRGARNGLEPDLAGVTSGVTTLVDAGSAGSANFEGFHHHVVSGALTRVLAMIHIARHGLTHIPEASTLDDIGVDDTLSVLSQHPEIVGVKVRACGPVVESGGTLIIEKALEVARSGERRLMVHIGDANFGRSGGVTLQLLPLLRPGDILTHVYTGAPGRALDEAGRVLPALIAARERGVVLDAAHGRYNLSFDVARRMLDQGILPHTISTDITAPGRGGPVGSMTHTMGKFLALGFSLNEVIAMATHGPAAVLGMEEELGTLAEGSVADVAILEVVEGDWSFMDGQGALLTGSKALRPSLTFTRGIQVTPDYGPFPWGWLPNPG